MVRNLFKAIVYGLAIVLGLLLGAGLSLSRLHAQEIASEATVEAVAPIVVEDGGLVVVEAPEAAPPNNLYVAIGAALFALVSVCVVVVQRGNAVQAAKVQIEQIQANRQAVEGFERLYIEATQANRSAFNTVVGILKVFAPLIPGDADEALGKLLEDIQTPGPPAHGSLSQPKRTD